MTNGENIPNLKIAIEVFVCLFVASIFLWGAGALVVWFIRQAFFK